MFGCSSPIMIDIDGDMEHSHRHFRSSFGSFFVLILLTLDYAAHDDPLLGEAPIHIIPTRNSTSGPSQPFKGLAASSICAPCGGLVGCWGAPTKRSGKRRGRVRGEEQSGSNSTSVEMQTIICPKLFLGLGGIKRIAAQARGGCASATGGPQWDDPFLEAANKPRNLVETQ